MRRFILYTLGLSVTLPVLLLLYLSWVQQWRFPVLWEASFSWAAWQALLQGTTDLQDSFWRSLVLSGSVAFGATFFGVVLSQLLTRTARGQRLITLAYYPYLIAPVILGAMLQFYFVRLDLAGTVLGVALAQILFVFPYGVLLMATFWTTRIRQFEFQAKSLGASDRFTFWRLLFPLARPWLGLTFIQCFLISWFEYGITQFVGVGKVETLTIQTMHYVKASNPHYAAVAACLMVLPLVVLLFINQKWILRSAL